MSHREVKAAVASPSRAAGAVAETVRTSLTQQHSVRENLTSVITGRQAGRWLPRRVISEGSRPGPWARGISEDGVREMVQRDHTVLGQKRGLDTFSPVG